MTNLRSGINVSRRISGGGGSSISEELRHVRSQGAMPVLQFAVVADIIYDPKLLTTEDKNSLAEQVANPRAISHMPRNSIIARITSNANDLGDPRPRIIYPFQQSHIALPLKPGEQVFVIYPDPHLDGHEQGYWMGRVPEPETVEDLNFTHGDRRYDQSLDPDNQSTSERANQNNNNSPPPPNFPNGAGTPETLSLFVGTSSDRPYEAIFTGSVGNKQVTFEAVPRYTKRPAELALQGSNNSRIVFGEDRTGPATRVTSSNDRTDKVGKAGTIDIVAGVGSTRFLPEDDGDDPTQTNPDKRPTAPQVIENTRNYKEVDKTSFLRQKQDNIREGDPDFKRDLSRIYVSMKTAGDKNFQIKFGGDGGIFPNSSDKLNTEIEDLPDDGENGQPFIVVKSEHLRFIATGKDKQDQGGPSEHGDIRIIKEGSVDDKDLGMLILNKDGEVVAVGKNIQLHTHENGKVFVRCKDDSDADPIILFSKFKELEQDVHSKINDLKNGIADQLQNFITTTITAPNAAGPFSPVPALVAMQSTIASTVNQIKAINVDFTDKIDPCKSKWIFVSKENQG